MLIVRPGQPREVVLSETPSFFLFPEGGGRAVEEEKELYHLHKPPRKIKKERTKERENQFLRKKTKERKSKKENKKINFSLLFFFIQSILSPFLFPSFFLIFFFQEPLSSLFFPYIFYFFLDQKKKLFHSIREGD